MHLGIVLSANIASCWHPRSQKIEVRRMSGRLLCALGRFQESLFHFQGALRRTRVKWVYDGSSGSSATPAFMMPPVAVGSSSLQRRRLFKSQTPQLRFTWSAWAVHFMPQLRPVGELWRRKRWPRNKSPRKKKRETNHPEKKRRKNHPKKIASLHNHPTEKKEEVSCRPTFFKTGGQL